MGCWAERYRGGALRRCARTGLVGLLARAAIAAAGASWAAGGSAAVGAEIAVPAADAGPGIAAAGAAAPLAFALIGDLPYGSGEMVVFDRLIDALNADRTLAFVLHAGDIKGSAEPCTDELLRARFEQLQRIAAPLLYTPGDNEWTDCHRRRAGGFHPLERLAFLRRLFFADPGHTLGRRPLAVRSQRAQAGFEDFVENALFALGGVVVASVHVPGSNNDLEPWSGIDAVDAPGRPRGERLLEFRRRERAALAWIDTAFERAEAEGAAGVVVLMQANPRFELAPAHPDRAGFAAITARLRDRALAFARPVLLAHGDQHVFRVDQPFGADGDPPAVPLLTRVQSFGSPRMRWVRVRVEPGSPRLFEVEAMPVP